MQVHSFFIADIEPRPITIEFSSRFQIPGFQILGLPAPEIQEARERITSAFHSSGLEFPKKKILINLSPASIRKSGTGHDLAIALKILFECDGTTPTMPTLAWGELGLDGGIRKAGKMAHLIELLLRHFKERGPPGLFLSPEDHTEFRRLCDWRRRNGLTVPEPSRIHPVGNLKELCSLLRSPGISGYPDPDGSLPEGPPGELPHASDELHLLPLPPFQERIVKIGSIGRHHVLVLGPKGVGKSSSFEWFRHLAPIPHPQLSWERALYLESRHESPRFDIPVRQIHAQVRPSHLLGSVGSAGFRAGELSLAHGGVLFADEFVEWPRDSKECLREPLQTQRLLLTRVKGSFEAKCDIQLVASGNLCQCGGIPVRFRIYGTAGRIKCRCSESEVRSYLKKLSGPILDRIDLVAIFGETPSADSKPSRSLPELRREIASARSFALDRFGTLPATLPPRELVRQIPETGGIPRILGEIPSLRARHKIIRVALSIQALEGAGSLREEHVLESRSYRFLEDFP